MPIVKLNQDAALVVGKRYDDADRLAMVQGANRYAAEPAWLKPGDGAAPLGSTHGAVAVDRQGLIYLSMDAGDFGVAIYNQEGEQVSGIAEEFVGTHDLVCVNEDGEDFLYGVHLAGKRVYKMTLAGQLIWAFGCPVESGKYEDVNQYAPTSVAVASDRSLFVADGYGQNWIHQFDPEQNYIRSFGGAGSSDGRFTTCHGISIDTRQTPESLLVCDRENRRIQRFSLEGEFIEQVISGLHRPCSLAFDGEHVAIAELEGRVSVFDGQHRLRYVLGDNSTYTRQANYEIHPSQWQDGVLNAPHGLAFDHEGNLIVMEWNRWGRVSLFRRQSVSE